MLITILLTVMISCIYATALCAKQSGAVQQELIKTIVATNSRGDQLTELAFRAPAKGFPKHVIDMYCANIKLRLYWGVYRETLKSSRRTDQDVRRLARLARHYYPDIRAVDNPFGAPKLSKIDKWLGVKEKEKDKEGDFDSDWAIDTDDYLTHSESDSPLDSEVEFEGQSTGEGRITKLKRKIKLKLIASKNADHDVPSDDEETFRKIKQRMDASFDDGAGRSTSQKMKTKLGKIRDYVKKYAPKLGIGIYTRWTTMWWLMMSCLFTKYYLWDPALDEFIKLKKTMIMYPDFLKLRLQDVQCLPTKFFQRIIGLCKILNPLLNFSFGQLSLDNMMRFNGQAD